LKIKIKIGSIWERTLMNHKRYKKHNILHLENIKKIGNVLERILIYHKKYKKDNILHLDNIVKSEMFGKEHLCILKSIKKTILYILKI
jgi:hypothetical protein